MSELRRPGMGTTLDPALLLPHARPMQLLHRVLEHGPGGAVCEVRSADAALFRDGAGRLPCHVAIEWMAQCAGIYGALQVIARGETPGLGFLTGGRTLRFHTAFLPGDALLRVEARPVGHAAGLYSFACRVVTDAGEPLAEGRLGIFVPQLAPRPDGS